MVWGKGVRDEAMQWCVMRLSQREQPHTAPSACAGLVRWTAAVNRSTAGHCCELPWGPQGACPSSCWFVIHVPAHHCCQHHTLQVLASYGHIRDLPAKQGSVQPDDGFAMKWSVLDNAEGRLAPIVGAARTASRILLATDPDREGEAISWHLLQELQARKAIRKVTPTERITFTEGARRAYAGTVCMQWQGVNGQGGLGSRDRGYLLPGSC